MSSKILNRTTKIILQNDRSNLLSTNLNPDLILIGTPSMKTQHIHWPGMFLSVGSPSSNSITSKFGFEKGSPQHHDNVQASHRYVLTLAYPRM